MGYRTVATRATLTLLAVVCAAALGASQALAAPQHTASKIHKISSCGYTAHTAGTYELTKSLSFTSGDCITLAGNNITLYLDGHTITDDGSGTCLMIEGANGYESANESVVGGTKAKPAKTATLTDCQYGLRINQTSATKASHLKIVTPTSFGVRADYAAGMNLSNVKVALHDNSAHGFFLENGSGNVVTHCVVENNADLDSFFAQWETGDTFTYDTATISDHDADVDGVGFHDFESSRNTYSHDTAIEHFDGFNFDEGGYGTVTATYNTATGPADIFSSYGFYVNGAYQASDDASPSHTLIAHNKATGFQDDYYDNSAGSGAVAEKWIDNRANNYAEWGFYVEYPTNYTMTGNIADGNTAHKKYDGSSATWGFYLNQATSNYPFKVFAHNQAYDSEYGFYSATSAVSGKGNVAKRNKYNSYRVQISG